jgi:hypothetical protein
VKEGQYAVEGQYTVQGQLQLPSVELQREVQIFTGGLEVMSNGIRRLQVRLSTDSVIMRFNLWLDINVPNKFVNVWHLKSRHLYNSQNLLSDFICLLFEVKQLLE